LLSGHCCGIFRRHHTLLRISLEMNFVLLVLVALLGVAHVSQSFEADQQYLEAAEISEFDALGQDFAADDCEDPPPASAAPDCRSRKKTTPPSADCWEKDQLEAILRMLKEVTPKLEAALKTSKPKGASGAPSKDVKSAVEGRRWSTLHDENASDLRNFHSGRRGARFRNRSPWRADV
jgi:hypothetical protein